MDRTHLRAILGPSAVVALAAGLSVASNVPRPWAPFSLVAVVPGMIVSSIGMGWFADEQNYVSPITVQALGSVGSALFIAIAFFAWSRHRVESARIPQNSAVVFSFVGLANFALLAGSWSYGTRYQGSLHTALIVLYNLIALLGCIGLYLRNRRTPSSASNLAFHTLFFAALGFCAFPWLGELL